MSDINHSKTPNLSIGTLDGNSGVSAAFLNVDSTASLTVGGIAAFTGTESHSGTATFSGAVNLTSAFTLGTNGFSLVGLRSSTVSVALGTVGLDSITTNVTINAMAANDPVLRIVPSSLWSGSYFDIGLEGVCSTSSTMVLVARNSAATAINTTAMNMTVYWLDLA